jgi:hypothetical protein
MNEIQQILSSEYINLTELLAIIEELKLEYTRQGLNVMQRNPKNTLFQYDAKAFGSYFFRKEKVIKILDYIGIRRGTLRTPDEIENAIVKVIKNKRQIY